MEDGSDEGSGDQSTNDRAKRAKILENKKEEALAAKQLKQAEVIAKKKEKEKEELEKKKKAVEESTADLPKKKLKRNDDTLLGGWISPCQKAELDGAEWKPPMQMSDGNGNSYQKLGHKMTNHLPQQIPSQC